jgi:hypothetical protein
MDVRNAERLQKLITGIEPLVAAALALCRANEHEKPEREAPEPAPAPAQARIAPQVWPKAPEAQAAAAGEWDVESRQGPTMEHVIDEVFQLAPDDPGYVLAPAPGSAITSGKRRKDTGTHASPRPHSRQRHETTVWTGPRSAKVPKRIWIEPIRVKCPPDDAGDVDTKLPVVLHDIG